MKLKKKQTNKQKILGFFRNEFKKIAPHTETEKLKSFEAKLELKCEAIRTGIDESSLEIEFCSRERERADSGFRFGLERCRRGDSSEREREREREEVCGSRRNIGRGDFLGCESWRTND